MRFCGDEAGDYRVPQWQAGSPAFPHRIWRVKAKDVFVKDSVKDEAGVGTWWGGRGVFVEFASHRLREWKEILKRQC